MAQLAVHCWASGLDPRRPVSAWPQPSQLALDGGLAWVAQQAGRLLGRRGVRQTLLRHQGLDSGSESDPAETSGWEVGALDWQALGSGAVGVLALSCLGRHEQRLRWVLVSGLERVPMQRSAWLLLQPGWPSPWGSGFNARLGPSGSVPWLTGLDGQRVQVHSVRRFWLARG